MFGRMKLAPQSATTVDTSSTFAIRRSVPKIARLIAVCVITIALGLWMSFGGGAAYGLPVVLIGGFVAILCCMVLVVSTYRLVFGAKAPLTLAPSGLLDTRICASEIPWSSLSAISTWKPQTIPFVLIDIDRDDFWRLELTRSARIGRYLNADLTGRYYICISTSDLSIPYAKLLAAIIAYARAYNPDISIET